jgi:hypothetical protein
MSRSQIIRVSLAAVVVFAVTAYALWSHFANPSTSKYEPVIEQLAGGSLNPDKLGRVRLTSYSGLTPKDEIFVTRRADGSFVAFFPTYYGPGICIAGTLYTSRPLQDQDTYHQELSTAFDRRLIDVGSWPKLSIDKKLDDHWFMVSRGLH